MVKFVIIYLFLSFLFVSVSPIFARKQGQAKIDSLLSVLPKAKEDTNKVNLLNEISTEYDGINPEEGIKYGEKGLILAEKLGWKKGIADASNSLGVCYDDISNYTKALENYFKALEINQKIGQKNGIAINLVNIGIIYDEQSDYPKALEFYFKALKINQEIGHKRGIATNLGNIGIIYDEQGDYSKALENYLKALNLFEELGYKSGIARNLMNIGGIYDSKSDYPKALEYFFKALKIYEEIGNKSGIASSLLNIGNIYDSQSDFPKALDYFFKSMNLYEELGGKKVILRIQVNIGNIYFSQKDYSKSLEYYTKSLKIFEEMGDKSGLALLLGNIGNLYNTESDYPKALVYYLKALKIGEEIGDKGSIARNLGNIGELYLKLATDTLKTSERNDFDYLNKKLNLQKSVEYSLKAVEIAKEIGDLGNLKNIYTTLAGTNKELGDYQKAYEYSEEAHKLQDSIFSTDKTKKIATLEAVKDKEIADKQIEIQKLQILKVRNESYLLYGGIALFAFIIIIIYYQRKASEKLLLNILPAKIAKRLKRNENPISDHIAHASVLFADVVNFTQLSSELHPNKVVGELNKIYTIIDKLVEKHKMEKIKTIGDCYMAVAGVPDPATDHAERAAGLALDIQETFKDYKIENGSDISFRIGLDSGEVTAGVIGEKKFIYDLWGDTVNTAARMESYGVPGKIQVTERFKEKLIYTQHAVSLQERGEIEIKGKGLMRTYFLGNKI